ncbi:DMT family transporter [Aestuariivirga sp.]|uniref:DMT family transporter n=1 Tax=Aestuariivirga sp. TaxID=2650926 RepID=UPI0035B2F423
MIAADSKPASHFLPAIAVALCGAMWGVFWIPLHWFGSEGVGGAWVSLIFNAMAMLSALPFLLRRDAWEGVSDQAVNGLLLGTAFSLYTVSLVLTDVIHAILLFYLTPVWSTLAGRFFLQERLSASRILAMALGFAGLAAVLGVKDGIPLPRNWGDGLALLSGMCWAAGTLRSFHRPTRKVAMPVFSFAAGGFVSSAVILAIAATLALPLAEVGHMRAMLPWIMLLGLIIFVPPNFLVLWAAQRIDSARVGILLMTEVLFGTLSAGLLSGQAFTLAEGVGTAFIVSAGLIEVLRR